MGQLICQVARFTYVVYFRELRKGELRRNRERRSNSQNLSSTHLGEWSILAGVVCDMEAIMGRAHDHETRQRRLEEALQQSEQRFEHLVEAAKDYAIFMTDADGRVSTWNEGAQRLFGYGEAEIPRRGRFSPLHARGP